MVMMMMVLVVVVVVVVVEVSGLLGSVVVSTHTLARISFFYSLKGVHNTANLIG